MNVSNGSRVALNTRIKLRGQASGANLPPGEQVDMHYEYVNEAGQVLGSALSRGVPFAGSTATDPSEREFTVNQPGHYFFRLFIRYDGGSKEGIRSFACLKDTYVETPPPKPEKQVECTNLIASFSNGQRVVAGTTINVRGQASGRNLPQGELADMYYDYVDSAGKVVSTQKAMGVPFKDGTAIDNVPRSFKLEAPGTYKFRLAVKYDGSTKSAVGNQTGNCVKEIVVQPPCEQSQNNNEAECIILNKRASNITHNIPDANGTIAQPGDIIVYTLSAKNTSKNTMIKKFIMEENISDVLEYADIVNLHGGTKDDRNIVRWPATDIRPEQTIEKQLTVRVKNPLPQTPTSVSNPGSFDMTLTNVYGTTVNIKLPPSITKTTEQVTTNLPNTGPGETVAVGLSVTVVVGYFFARSRLMVKELELIRSEYAASGGI
jgi:hypothetical protein